MSRRFLFAVAVGMLACGQAFSQYDPPKTVPPDEAMKKDIVAKTELLGIDLEALRRLSVHDPVLAEVEVYHKAAVWMIRHGEYFQKDTAKQTLAILDRGLLRAAQAARGESPWLQAGGREVARAYRSHLDGSVQPYAVSYPADYGKDPRKQWRLDIVLHGRDSSLSEVKFLFEHGRLRATPKEQDFVQLEVYGRGNNAYRWAGETDLFEALESFQAVEHAQGRSGLLDPRRVVLRGFSMGGAGSWHLGLHHPDRWCVIGPGAGFSTTHGYIGGLPARLPKYQEKCLRIYDAVDYAENAFNVPVVAYGGADDPQLQAARNIEARLKPLGIPMILPVAPGLKHQFPTEWRKRAEAEYLRYAGPDKGREEYPARVRFVTYTLKYSGGAWVEILAMKQHYEQARVDAEKSGTGFDVKTSNVRVLRLRIQDLEPAQNLTVRIDGQEVAVHPRHAADHSANVFLERAEDGWKETRQQKLIVDCLRRMQKTTGLQGPIDDAFTSSFLCVRGTGKPWHEAVQKHADASLRRFQDEWNKYFRGELRIKDDVNVTEDDLGKRNLILFGDLSSNALIAQVADRLPVKWTAKAVEVGGKSYASAEHVPVLIYPSPLHVGRYIVLNSGHTFHAAEFRGTNAQSYPRLGDYAVLKLGVPADPLATTTAVAGLFDDFWQVVPGAGQSKER